MSKKGGGSGNQTVTQKNLPDWAMGYARNTMDMGNQYTMNPDYRPSTLDRDYSGIRGYNPQGQPNSQVGQFGLNPNPVAPNPNRFNILPGIEYTPEKPAMEVFGKGQLSFDQYQEYKGLLDQGLNEDEAFSQAGGTSFPSSRGGGRTARGTNPGENYQGGPSGSSEYIGPGWDLDGDAKGYFYDGDGATESDSSSSDSGGSSSNQSQQTQSSTNTEEEEPSYQFNPEEMTPFTAYDRQRFANPNANITTGEGIMAGRYGQRFTDGVDSNNPFAGATDAAQKAADYSSSFASTVDPTADLQSYTNFQGMNNPGVFSGQSYQGQVGEFANPNANLSNVNAGMGNVNAGVQNVNANMRSATYGNANQGITGPVDYQQQNSFRNQMQRYQDPYMEQVVGQTIKDLDRSRQIASNQAAGRAAAMGAFGGSRSQLAQSEIDRNFMDQTAAAVGQLRSQGFQRAADMAQQENLQRLGLSAQDLQQVRGLTSQGNLQGQNLTARDLQDVRGLQSQGALTAQGLRSQGALTAQGLRSQGGLAAQGLQSQGELAALNANQGLQGQALGLDAASDRAAMGFNADLLSQGRGLEAQDLAQLRNIYSGEQQFAENALRNAGALNLQAGGVLGNLAQMGTADERQRIADMLAAGAAQQGRDQQDLDFIYNEFNRELDYPGRQIDLRNAAISPATGSIVQTTQPRYQSNPLLGAAGAGLSAYGITKNPYAAGGAALLSLLYG